MNELKIENQWIWKEMEAKWMNYMYMIGKTNHNSKHHETQNNTALVWHRANQTHAIEMQTC